MQIDRDVTYYISGPMTGIPEFNYPLFRSVANRCRALGLDIESPHENPPPPPEVKSHSGECLDAHMLPCRCGAARRVWEYYMEKCMEQMNRCRGIILLQGWTHSSGARLEVSRAIEEEWPYFYFYRGIPGTLIQMHLE